MREGRDTTDARRGYRVASPHFEHDAPVARLSPTTKGGSGAQWSGRYPRKVDQRLGVVDLDRVDRKDLVALSTPDLIITDRFPGPVRTSVDD